MSKWESKEMKRIALFLAMLVLLVGTLAVGCNGKSSTTTPSNSSPPPPAPAEFQVSNLTVTPSEAEIGGEVVVSVDVANIGGSQGSTNVVLNINGVQEETKSVTIVPNQSEVITFNIAGQLPGTYTIDIGDLSGIFSVLFNNQSVLFNYQSVLFGAPSTLSSYLETIDKTSGDVVVNGTDSRQPTIPSTFNWGDGTVDSNFFPANHKYSDTNINYVVTVTAHYSDGTTGSAKTVVRFISPVIDPISLPANINVTFPEDTITLTSHMLGYNPPTGLSYFEDSYFSIVPRSTVEYVLSVMASIQLAFANNDVYMVDGGFNQVILCSPGFGGMFSLWFTSPVSFAAGDEAFQGTIPWTSFMHEMGHNVTLNSPADYFYGGKIDGNANAIFSETMAQIFQHSTAYYLLNHYQDYGLSDDLAIDIEQSALASMRIVRNLYEDYLIIGKNFASWNDPSTPGDETLLTFMTIAYKYFEHAEHSDKGYAEPLKRMMTLLQTFDADMRVQYDQSHDTADADTFRATLMVAALSYAFETDLREEFRELNFPINDELFNDLRSI